MNWSAISQKVFKFAVLLAAASAGYYAFRQTVLYGFTSREAEGLNTIILLVSGIFSVMYAFVVFVIWTQFAEVENFVMRECNALNDLLRFGSHVNPDVGHAVHRAVSDYCRAVLKSEWQSLSRRRRDPLTEKAFSEIVDAVLANPSPDAAEEAARRRLTDILQLAGQQRDDRIAKSLTRIPPTLVRLVHTMAAVLLAMMFVYPFHHWAVGVACFDLLAVVLFLANVVMEDTDNPFEGVCNISPKPFSDLLHQ